MTHTTPPVFLVRRSLASLLLLFTLACDDVEGDAVNSWDDGIEVELDDVDSDDVRDFEPQLDIPHDDEPLPAVDPTPTPCGPSEPKSPSGHVLITANPPSSGETPPLKPIVTDSRAPERDDPGGHEPDHDTTTLTGEDPTLPGPTAP